MKLLSLLLLSLVTLLLGSTRAAALPRSLDDTGYFPRPSPSPQPSPLGRGNHEVQLWNFFRASDSPTSGSQFSLSLRERAGVRGKGACDLPAFKIGLVTQTAWQCRAAAAELPDLPKPASRTVKHLHGWTVRVDDRLLMAPNDGLGQRALQMLEAKLSDIEYVVAKDRLEKLRSITIVLDLTHGRLRTMQYHPSAGWLEEHGYSKELAKCVHICDAADFARARQVNEQPWVVLHELAHAYHDQVLGFEEPRIREVYEKFKQSGHGENVLLFNGTRTRHYALTDPKEFFAEFTEAYFGLNDFFPFNRAELKTAEPEIYELMAGIWGPIQTGSPPLGHSGP